MIIFTFIIGNSFGCGLFELPENSLWNSSYYDICSIPYNLYDIQVENYLKNLKKNRKTSLL